MECSEFAKSYQSDKGKKVLLDVREPGEVAEGKLKEAINIPLSNLPSRVGEVPKDANVYIYCRSGRRAQSAKDVLTGAGYKNVFSAVNGGFEELSCLIQK